MKNSPGFFKHTFQLLLLTASSAVLLQACNSAIGEEAADEEELVTVPVEAATAKVSDIAASRVAVPE